MTIVVDAPEVEQVKKQLHKLINVVKISEFDPESLDRARDHARAGGRRPRASGARSSRSPPIFDAIAVDVGANSISFQIAGDPRKVNDFLELVRPYGLVELVKSGRVALAREPKGTPGQAAGRHLSHRRA